MGKGSRNASLCWEVVPISEGPLSEVPLYQLSLCLVAEGVLNHSRAMESTIPLLASSFYHHFHFEEQCNENGIDKLVCL